MLAPPLRTQAANSFVKKAKVKPGGKEGVEKGISIDIPISPLLPVHPGPTGNNLETLLQEASKLSAKDKAELLARLSLQASEQDARHSRDQDMWSQALYDALVKENGGSGRGLPGPALVKRAVAVGAPWTAVAGFMEASGYDKLKVPERLAMYEMLAKLLMEHALEVSDRTGAPLTPKLLANCSSNIAAVFNAAFPGYLRAGLGLIVARQLTSRKFSEGYDEDQND
jgi:hypothetical protein